MPDIDRFPLGRLQRVNVFTCRGVGGTGPANWPFCPHCHSIDGQLPTYFPHPLSSISKPVSVCWGNDWETSFATWSITARES